jgi:hypothetical protein
MTQLISDLGSGLVAAGGGIAIAAALYATVVLPADPSRALHLRRFVRLGVGVFLFGAGLKVATAEPPITIAWGLSLIVMSAYLFRQALRSGSQGTR